MMSKPPTDLQIFQRLYDMYLDDFRTFSNAENERSSKTYVPVDLRKVAEKLGSDPYELFGRLYNHLDHKFGYQQEGGARVHLFAPQVGGDRHCVNFPYLAGVLADYRLEDRRNRWSFAFSLLALVVAGASLFAKLLFQ